MRDCNKEVANRTVTISTISEAAAAARAVFFPAKTAYSSKRPTPGAPSPRCARRSRTSATLRWGEVGSPGHGRAIALAIENGGRRSRSRQETTGCLAVAIGRVSRLRRENVPVARAAEGRTGYPRTAGQKISGPEVRPSAAPQTAIAVPNRRRAASKRKRRGLQAAARGGASPRRAVTSRPTLAYCAATTIEGGESGPGDKVVATSRLTVAVAVSGRMARSTGTGVTAPAAIIGHGAKRPPGSRRPSEAFSQGGASGGLTPTASSPSVREVSLISRSLSGKSEGLRPISSMITGGGCTTTTIITTKGSPTTNPADLATAVCRS